MNGRKIGGFTLTEVAISVFILSFLSLVVYLFFWGSSSAWEKGKARLEVYQNLRYPLKVMSRELKTAFISPHSSSFIFLGREKEIHFISTLNSPSGEGKSDLCEISYYLNEKGQLIRRKDSTPDDKPLKGGGYSPLASGVTFLQFSYWDGEKWSLSWDSTRGTPQPQDDLLPQKVKITLSVRDERGIEPEFTLSTEVYLLQEKNP